MVDRFEYEAPLGVLGKLADAVFLERYMRRLLEARASFLKELAEHSRRMQEPSEGSARG